MGWKEQQKREEELLNLERAGGLCLGTGLGGGFHITHTIGVDAQGKYGSFVVLTLQNNAGEEISIPFDPTWGGTLDKLICSLEYHGKEAARLTKQRQRNECLNRALAGVDADCDG